nr:MAG TPA: hypothetical protein [Caudoviricetes sp.]
MEPKLSKRNTTIVRLQNGFHRQKIMPFIMLATYIVVMLIYLLCLIIQVLMFYKETILMISPIPVVSQIKL